MYYDLKGLLIGFWVALLVIDFLLITSKLPMYFRTGIKIYRKNIKYSFKPELDNLFLEELYSRKRSVFIGLFVFKIISKSGIFFCEDPQLPVRRLLYPPIMHGIIIFLLSFSNNYNFA